LEHFEHYKEYITLFEQIMHRFIEAEGLTLSTFYAAITKELEGHIGDKESSFASVLLSAIDFTAFCEMMSDVKAGRGVVFCPPLVSLEKDFYGDQDPVGVVGTSVRGARYDDLESFLDEADTSSVPLKMLGEEKWYDEGKDHRDLCYKGSIGACKDEAIDDYHRRGHKYEDDAK
jgi:hypothetical protein